MCIRDRHCICQELAVQLGQRYNQDTKLPKLRTRTEKQPWTCAPADNIRSSRQVHRMCPRAPTAKVISFLRPKSSSRLPDLSNTT
eukprot:6751473-Heterocapsa_arctica.AAC.1